MVLSASLVTTMLVAFITSNTFKCFAPTSLTSGMLLTERTISGVFTSTTNNVRLDAFNFASSAIALFVLPSLTAKSSITAKFLFSAASVKAWRIAVRLALTLIFLL
jgi:hypothetical protein